MAGLYIHIPFCASRCIYCGFYSTTQSQLQNQYVEALCREMELTDHDIPIGTIYLGGGTPSQLSHANLTKLFAHIYKVYQVDKDAEVTMECNPDDIQEGMFLNLPVNRVSMGAQTFSDERLRFLRRRHTAAEVAHAVKTLRNDGIHNISIDLMFGFPNESMTEWQEDIAHVLDINPTHISAYGLMYEEGSALYRLLEQSKIEEIDEEVSLEMYDTLVDSLVNNGYEHYEISNFAKPGFRSKHNSSYWHNVPYIGLGASAHSYDLTSRSWNVADIKAYMASIQEGTLPQEKELLDEGTRYNDLITTALRTKEGIDTTLLSPEMKAFLLKNAEPHIAQNYLTIEKEHLRLTRAGINISNSIMSDLMAV